MIAQLRVVKPSNDFRSVPVRPPNSELRTREYLTPAEVEKLIKAAKDGRWGRRDATLVLIAFRHGLRASEICDLEWSQVEFGRSASLHVRRIKNGKPSVHPLRGEEIRALRELRRQFPDSGFVFATERGGPFTPDAVNRLIKRIGERAGFDFPVHATCCAMAAATPWRTPDTTPGLFKIGSAIERSSTLCATPNWRRRGSRISGANSPAIPFSDLPAHLHASPPSH